MDKLEAIIAAVAILCDLDDTDAVDVRVEQLRTGHGYRASVHACGVEYLSVSAGNVSMSIDALAHGVCVNVHDRIAVTIEQRDELAVEALRLSAVAASLEQKGAKP